MGEPGRLAVLVLVFVPPLALVPLVLVLRMTRARLVPVLSLDLAQAAEGAPADQA
ncbi:MAG: hypothetical protein H6719_10050 [Sandaracinaceae bacterium]|nr:hypothetical protein [Sandaracinaceae bacterium]